MACTDYIVDTCSELRLCRCGYPKSVHSSQEQRRQRRSMPTALQCARSSKPEVYGERPIACSDFIIDVTSEQRLCRCGCPKSMHVDAPLQGLMRRPKLDRWETPTRGRIASEPAAKAVCTRFVLDLKSKFMYCKCGLPKSMHTDDMLHARRPEGGEAVMEVVRSFSVRYPDQPPTPTNATPAGFTHLKDLAIKMEVERIEGILKSRESWAAASSYGLSERSMSDAFESFPADARSWAGESTDVQSREVSSIDLCDSREDNIDLCDSREDNIDRCDSQTTERQDSLGSEVTSIAMDESCENDAPGVLPLVKDEVKDYLDGTKAASKVCVERVTPIWTVAAADAQTRAAEDRAAAEQRAAEERQRQVKAATAARERAEVAAAKLREKEQAAIEEARQKARDDAERQKVAADEERLRQRQAKRLRKAQEAEALLLRQAEEQERLAREKAARLAAARTVTVCCSCGGELMVTPEELYTLHKYVKGYESMTAVKLAELLPSLRMGAWCQGTKHLFKKSGGSDIVTK